VFKRGVSPSFKTFPLSLSKERGPGGEVTINNIYLGKGVREIGHQIVTSTYP